MDLIPSLRAELKRSEAKTNKKNNKKTGESQSERFADVGIESNIF